MPRRSTCQRCSKPARRRPKTRSRCSCTRAAPAGRNARAPAAPAASAAPAIVADGDFGMAGTSRAWALIGKATLARDGQQAQVRLDGRGDAEQLRLRTLRVAMPTGTLDA